MEEETFITIKILAFVILILEVLSLYALAVDASGNWEMGSQSFRGERTTDITIEQAGNSTSQENTSKESMAAKEFIIRGGCSSPAKVLPENFHSELSKTDKFQVMAAEKMQSILRKNGIQEDWQCQNKECLIGKGRILGVDAMVFGTIVKLRADFIITVRKINIKTAELFKILLCPWQGRRKYKIRLGADSRGVLCKQKIS